MKRALIILGVVALLGLIAFLGVTRYFSRQHAASADRELAEAQGRIIQMEEELQATKQMLADCKGSATAKPATAATPAGQRRFVATMGAGVTNLVRIEGTSSVHPWQVEGHLIGGWAEFGPGFPTQSADAAPGAALAVRASVFIPVSSLKSVEADGSPYSDAMDGIMYEKMRAEEFRRITFTLTSLSAAAQPTGTNGAVVYEAKGELGLAGQTNAITMSVSATTAADGKLQFVGTTRVKMTDFKISPPSPSLGPVSIKTGDEVTLKFIWWVKPALAHEAPK